MSFAEELLAPISDEEPAGPDASFGNAYSAIEQAFHDVSHASSVIVGGDHEAPNDSYAEVVELGTAFLKTESKDLKVGALLASSLLREEGIAGLAHGLELVAGLLDRFWEGLHPGAEGRAAVLSWLGEDLASAVELARVTEAGHTYLQYREWAKGTGESGGEESGEEDAEQEMGFGQGLSSTSWTWLDELRADLSRAAAGLENLDTVGRERFTSEGVRPPHYRNLAGQLKRFTAATEDLLGRKPPPAVRTSETGEDDSDDSTEALVTQAAGAAASAPVGKQSVIEPQDPAGAQRAVAAAAKVLRNADPSNPAPYMLVRGLRWGELRAGGDHPDPRVLVAPATELRTQLKTLFLDQQWATLLETSEAAMASPVGRGWLDLQRYSIVAAERLGVEYRPVVEALTGALQALLTDLPHLLQATLMDDSGAVSPDTHAWLESQGFIEGDGADLPVHDASDDLDAEAVLREASFGKAASMVRAGDPYGALELLQRRAERERSERARFMVRAEAAGIMVERGMASIARPILDELHEQVNSHQLEAWEASDVVAKPLALLYRCLEAGDGGLQQDLYNRLAKLDPLLAMEVRNGLRSEEITSVDPGIEGAKYNQDGGADDG